MLVLTLPYSSRSALVLLTLRREAVLLETPIATLDDSILLTSGHEKPPLCPPVAATVGKLNCYVGYKASLVQNIRDNEPSYDAHGPEHCLLVV